MLWLHEPSLSAVVGEGGRGGERGRGGGEGVPSGRLETPASSKSHLIDAKISQADIAYLYSISLCVWCVCMCTCISTTKT